MKKNWFDDRDYWNLNRSFIWTPKRVEQSAAAAEALASLMEMSTGDSVLDIPCGFGRYSIPLSQSGYSVTGVDLNPDFISEASAKASSDGLSAEFKCADMREYVSPESFDHIIVLYNSFGYFTDPADDIRVLENCFSSLRSGGKLMLHIHPRSGRGTEGPVRSWYEDHEGAFYLQESSENPERTRGSVKWIVLKGDTRREWEYGVRIYGEDEIMALLRSAGFSEVRCYGSLGGTAFETGNHSIYLLARK